MRRVVLEELLDTLPVDDPRAVQSRKDLQRINLGMGNARHLARGLRSFLAHPPQRVVELGAGDGTLLATLAPRIFKKARPELVRVDRLDVPPCVEWAALPARGWVTRTQTQDVFEWLEAQPPAAGTWLVANLFLHHFDEPQLARLMARAAVVANVFAACEPRRSRFNRVFVSGIGLTGACAVTRNDARLSVHAGFRGTELGRHWKGEVVMERSAGWFSHLFVGRT